MFLVGRAGGHKKGDAGIVNLKLTGCDELRIVSLPVAYFLFLADF